MCKDHDIKKKFEIPEIPCKPFEDYPALLVGVSSSVGDFVTDDKVDKELWWDEFKNKGLMKSDGIT